MRLHRFLVEDTRTFALTRDVGGARLPAFGGVWLYAGPAELVPDGRSRPDPARVKAEILKKGYYLWPDDAPEAPEAPETAAPPLAAAPTR